MATAVALLPAGMFPAQPPWRRLLGGRGRWLYGRRRSSGSAYSTARVSALQKATGGEQSTLGASIELSGVGLHCGEEAILRLVPAPALEGRYFALNPKSSQSPPNPKEQRIPARVHAVVDTRLSTTLGSGSARVHTVEHLLSALEGLGVDNVRMELEGGREVPILDGSAKCWVEAIKSVGVVAARDAEGRSVERFQLAPERPVVVYDGDSWVAAFPSSRPLLSYGIHFPQLPVVGRQWFSWSPEDGSYEEEVAAARTFGIMEQFEQLRAAGLIKGGSLENALVCSMERGWVNPPLRYADEPCRHKLLDLLGDLALAAGPNHCGLPLAHVAAFKASHSLHVKFGRALLEACMEPQLEAAT